MALACDSPGMVQRLHEQDGWPIDLATSVLPALRRAGHDPDRGCRRQPDVISIWGDGRGGAALRQEHLSMPSIAAGATQFVQRCREW